MLNIFISESRPLISILWGLLGAGIGPLFAFLYPRTRKSGFRFFVALSFMSSMLTIGLGFLYKSKVNSDRFQQIIRFPTVQARLVSCRVGQEAPSRYHRPNGRYFPIWTYQYTISSSDQIILSHSDSMPDFSIRHHFKTELEAQIFCQSWKSDELRIVNFDPLAPELSLTEIPLSYRAYNTDLFLAVVFMFFSIAGIIALLRLELKN